MQVRDGDIRRLEHLYEKHHVRLYNFFRRLTGDRQLSEDLVQDVFYRMLKYRHTFRGEGEFATWMYALARNVFKDHHRRNQPVTVELKDTPTGDPLPHQLLEEEQSRKLLEKALSQLPPEKREVLLLSRYQDLRYDAIAGILGCSVEAVKVRVHRAMNELRNKFFQLSGEEST